MRDKEAKILIADDEKDIRDIVKLLLTGEGYEIITAVNGKEVLEIASEDIDLYILDVNMPELSGFMAGAEIHKKYDAPIIFLTAYSTESDKVMGFMAGADDYIVKPFSNIELLMRVKAVLRRSSKMSSDNITSAKPGEQTNKNLIAFQDLYLDTDSQNIIKGDDIIPLTYTEFKILELLLTHRKKIYSLDNIYQSIWNDEAVSDSSIMVHIKNIRKKLGDNSRNAKYIKTAWGKGYYID